MQRRPFLPIVVNVLLPNGNAVVVFLGARCFWHVEAAIRRLPGVINTESGYDGGMTGIGNDDNVSETTTTMTARMTGISHPSPPPSFDTVCGGMARHAETVRVTLGGEALNPCILFD